MPVHNWSCYNSFNLPPSRLGLKHRGSPAPHFLPVWLNVYHLLQGYIHFRVSLEPWDGGVNGLGEAPIVAASPEELQWHMDWTNVYLLQGFCKYLCPDMSSNVSECVDLRSPTLEGEGPGCGHWASHLSQNCSWNTVYMALGLTKDHGATTISPPQPLFLLLHFYQVFEILPLCNCPRDLATVPLVAPVCDRVIPRDPNWDYFMFSDPKNISVFSRTLFKMLLPIALQDTVNYAMCLFSKTNWPCRRSFFQTESQPWI